MDKEKKDVIVADTLEDVKTYNGYLVHALCVEGCCSIFFKEKEILLQQGDLMIVRKGELISNVIPSKNCLMNVIYVMPGFIELSTPRNNYGMKGQLALFSDPVLHLTIEQQTVCLNNFEQVRFRLNNGSHHFYWEALISAVQMMIVDFFDFHSHQYGVSHISSQITSVMNRFLQMLDSGLYRKHRNVAYYADALCVTSKYLSEISKKVSGYGASYWINRYTMLDISRLLQDKSMTITAISDMFDFSSPAYFSRYVQNNLGMSPTDIRK